VAFDKKAIFSVMFDVLSGGLNKPGPARRGPSLAAFGCKISILYH